jgi:transposase
MTRLGMPQSDDTLLRSLKHRAATRAGTRPARVVGIDDWSWRKGSHYGTIMVDLERREVLDVLPDHRRKKRQRGSRGIGRSKSSAGTVVASTLRARRKAHPRRDRSPTGFTCSRTCDEPSNSR